MSYRVDVLHGVNLDQLGRRDPDVYGTFTLSELEVAVKAFARELELETTFWQFNHEGDFCEALHKSRERADGLLVNAGAWTHYSYAIRDALELCSLPAVEVHISDIERREQWRRTSVIRDVCAGVVAGKGIDGYREALELLKRELAR